MNLYMENFGNFKIIKEDNLSGLIVNCIVKKFINMHCYYLWNQENFISLFSSFVFFVFFFFFYIFLFI